MTEYIKIRCDDCKFVENCVDYGWDGCKKFTQKPSTPMTNEEYLRSCNTEQLAKVLKEMTDKCATCDTNQYDQRGECPFERCRIGLNEFVEWLKEKHE